MQWQNGTFVTKTCGIRFYTLLLVQSRLNIHTHTLIPNNHTHTHTHTHTRARTHSLAHTKTHTVGTFVQLLYNAIRGGKGIFVKREMPFFIRRKL
jgi:hypothetical protein